MKLTRQFKNASARAITQTYHQGHQALDLWAMYMTPLVAPEDVEILKVATSLPKEGPHFKESTLERGYGVWMKGLETGYIHLYWHTAAVLPVWGGETVKRGQIVAYMANSGWVFANNQYVPLEERNKPPYRGTHVHHQLYPSDHQVGIYTLNGINPLPLMDWNWIPTYTQADKMRSAFRVVYKMFKYRYKLIND